MFEKFATKKAIESNAKMNFHKFNDPTLFVLNSAKIHVRLKNFFVVEATRTPFLSACLRPKAINLLNIQHSALFRFPAPLSVESEMLHSILSMAKKRYPFLSQNFRSEYEID